MEKSFQSDVNLKFKEKISQTKPEFPLRTPFVSSFQRPTLPSSSLSSNSSSKFSSHNSISATPVNNNNIKPEKLTSEIANTSIPHTPSQGFFPGSHGDFLPSGAKTDVSEKSTKYDLAKLRSCYSTPSMRSYAGCNISREMTMPPILRKLGNLKGTLNLKPARAKTNAKYEDSSDEEDFLWPKSSQENASSDDIIPDNKEPAPLEVEKADAELKEEVKSTINEPSSSKSNNVEAVKPNEKLLPEKNKEAAEPAKISSTSSLPVTNSQPSSNSSIVINNKTYMMLKVVGKGGTSVVHQVFDSSNKQLYAVKCIGLSNDDPLGVEAYKNEIAQLRRLQGKARVIKMFDYEYKKAEEQLLVLMENGDADLGTLLHSLHPEERRNPVTIKFYWSEMLKAVAEIHEEGIIHFDLKPANFLLVSGKLKLIDFGISSAMQGDVTSVVKETQVGTLNFMSPEALCGGYEYTADGKRKPQIKISPKSDVWSLGIILYNLVYAKMPFQHIPHIAIKMQAIINPNHQIPFPSENVDPLLLDVLKKVLNRNPKERPSIRELLDHPFLTSSNANKGVNKVIEDLQSLTPRSIERVSKVLQELKVNKNKP